MVCATQRAAQCETPAGGVSARSRAQPDLRRASPVDQGPPSAARANWNSRQERPIINTGLWDAPPKDLLK